MKTCELFVCLCNKQQRQASMIVILWKRLNWLPTFIYVVKLDNERQRAELEEKKNFDKFLVCVSWVNLCMVCLLLKEEFDLIRMVIKGEMSISCGFLWLVYWILKKSKPFSLYNQCLISRTTESEVIFIKSALCIS